MAPAGVQCTAGAEPTGVRISKESASAAASRHATQQLLPPVPAKKTVVEGLKAIGKASVAEFTQMRLRSLNMFFEALLRFRIALPAHARVTFIVRNRLDYVKDDPSLDAFLSIQNDKVRVRVC